MTTRKAGRHDGSKHSVAAKEGGGLEAAQDAGGEERGRGGDGDVEQQDKRQDGEMRQRCGVEVGLADGEGGEGADDEAGDDSREREDQRLDEEERHELELRSAEGFHEGEVAAAFEDGGGERGEYGDADRERDEQNGCVHEGVRTVDDARLAFDELADGLDRWRGRTGCAGEFALQAGDGRLDSGGVAGDLNLKDGGGLAGPAREGGEGNVDA